MATLGAKQTGNFTSSSTWGVIESTTFPATRNLQEMGYTGTTTSIQSSATFTLASSTVCDGIYLKYGMSTGIGTVTVKVYNVTLAANVANTSTTFPTSSMYASGTSILTMSPNWIFIKFDANATLPASNTLRVDIQASVAGNATFYRKTTTAANWTFGLRTTTTAAPAAGDQMIIAPELVSAGTITAYTVTMDNTATTQFGTTSVGSSVLEINYGCAVKFGTSASTNYYLKCAGDIRLNEGSSFYVGEQLTPIPSTSTATIEFVNATTNGKYGIICRNSGESSGELGYLQMWGPNTRNYGVAYLNANASAGNTTVSVINSADVSGWKNGDYIVFPPTERTANQAESRNLSADASGATLTLNSALTYTHNMFFDSGSTFVTPIFNFTKNIKVIGTSALYNSYLQSDGFYSIDINNVEFQYMGGPGLYVPSKLSNSYFVGCSFRQGEITGTSYGIKFSSVLTEQLNLKVTDCLFYRIATNAVEFYNNYYSYSLMVNIYCVGTSSTASNKTSISINASNGAFDNIMCFGAGAPITIVVDPAYWLPTYGYSNDNSLFFQYIQSVSSTAGVNISTPNFTNLNNDYSLIFNSIYGNRTTSNVASFGYGLNFTGSNVLFKDCYFNENYRQNIQLNNSSRVAFHNTKLNSTATYTTPTCLTVDNSTDIKFVNSTSGATTTFLDKVTSNIIQDVDISFLGGSATLPTTVIPVAFSNVFTPRSKLSFSKNIVGSTDIFRTYKAGGIVESNNSTYYETGPSTLYKPDSTSSRTLTSEIKWVPVPAGKKVNISVYLNKDATFSSKPTLYQMPAYENAISNVNNCYLKTIVSSSSYSLSTSTWTKISGSSETATVDTVFGFFLSIPPQSGTLYVDKWEVYYE